MVDIFQPKDFNRNTEELQDFFVICWLVAGKIAWIQSKKYFQLKELLIAKYGNFEIFELLRKSYLDDSLLDLLKEVKTGKYTIFMKFAQEIITNPPDLRTAPTECLEQYSGVGMKTSRFFIANTRENCDVAILDTHILKFLKTIDPLTPSSTPANKQEYLKLEQRFLNYCLEHKYNPIDLDLEIWKKYAKKPR